MRRRSCRICLGAFFVFFLFYPDASSAPTSAPTAKETIAVLEFSGRNVSPDDASIIADFLRSALVKIGQYNVLDKANMDKILAETAFQQSGVTSSEDAVKVGKILNMQKMVMGTVSLLDRTYYVTANIVDVETGKIEKSETADCRSSDELMQCSARIAEQLSGMREGSIRVRTGRAGKRLALGLGTQMFSLLGALTPVSALEARYAGDLNTQTRVYGLRYYRYYGSSSFAWYTAADFDRIDFSGLTNDGGRRYVIGYMGGLSLGISREISSKLDMVVDVGPYYIDLDAGTVGGVEWIMNIGFLIYLF